MTFTVLAKVITFLVIMSIVLLVLYIRYEDELENLGKYFKEKRLYKAIHKKHSGIKE